MRLQEFEVQVCIGFPETCLSVHPCLFVRVEQKCNASPVSMNGPEVRIRDSLL